MAESGIKFLKTQRNFRNRFCWHLLESQASSCRSQGLLSTPHRLLSGESQQHSRPMRWHCFPAVAYRCVTSSEKQGSDDRWRGLLTLRAEPAQTHITVPRVDRVLITVSGAFGSWQIQQGPPTELPCCPSVCPSMYHRSGSLWRLN